MGGHNYPSKITITLASILLLTGCATDAVYRPDQLIRVEHPDYIAELIKPETAEFGNRRARFVEGGWLVSLTPKSTGEDIFHSLSVIPKYNARGLPIEFLDAIPLGKNRFLRIGVGIVSRKPGKGRFHDRIVERFPWFSEVTTDPAGTTVRFYQFAPRFYFYTRTLRFENESKTVTFEDELTNMGHTTLASRVYFHPFFKLPVESEPWCRLDSQPDFANPERPPLPGKGPSFFVTEKVPIGKTWFVCGADKPLAALWVENADEVGFWREKHASTQVFAVEPFVKLEVPPWETYKWTWGIAIP